MKQFWEKNKVFIMGLIGSLAVVVQQFTGPDVIEWKAVGFAALMAVLAYVANQWRGQVVTITGIIGTLAGVIAAMLTTGQFTWNQFIFSAIAAVLAAVAPPPKSRGYEKSETIVLAKAEGEIIKPTNLAPNPEPEIAPPLNRVDKPVA